MNPDVSSFPPYMLTTTGLSSLYGQPAKNIRDYVERGWLLSEQSTENGRQVNRIDRYIYEDFLSSARAGKHQKRPTDVSVSAIVLDPEIQARAGMSKVAVSEYAREMKSGIQYDPVILYGTADRWYCGDGHHRVAAALLDGRSAVPALCWPGGRDEALERCLRSNHKHGLRRTNEDKRRCVQQALTYYTKHNLSNKRIAAICGVSDVMVADVRRCGEHAGRVSTNAANGDGRLYIDMQRLADISRIRTDVSERTEAFRTATPENAQPLDEIAAIADLFCALAAHIRSLTRCPDSKLVEVARTLAMRDTRTTQPKQ